MEQLLPLLPLNTVLFPGVTLPLFIFEERYKQMIGRCIVFKEPFGIVLIREGEEVGGPAEPHEVGTTAAIVNVMPADDGQMFIGVEGRARFRIQHIVEREPYLVAAIELLDEEVGIEQQVEADRLRAIYERYRATVVHTMGGAPTLIDLPRDPVAMSFQLPARLQIPHFSKQQLLEADLDTRLEALASALTDELRFLPPVSGSPAPHGKSWSLN